MHYLVQNNTFNTYLHYWAWTLTFRFRIFAANFKSSKDTGMNIEQQIGKEIVRLRRSKHWSQERLAQEANISRHYLSEVENGVRQVSVSMVAKIVEAMKCEWHWTFNSCEDNHAYPS